jgi:hypothetical protein
LSGVTVRDYCDIAVAVEWERTSRVSWYCLRLSSIGQFFFSDEECCVHLRILLEFEAVIRVCDIFLFLFLSTRWRCY